MKVDGNHPVIGDAVMNLMPRASQWGELIRPDKVRRNRNGANTL